MTATQEPPELLTAREAAKKLRCSYGALAVGRCKRRTKLPYIKLGSKVLYRASDITAFLNANVVDPTASPEPTTRRRKAR